MEEQTATSTDPQIFLGAELLSAPQYEIDLNRPYLAKGLLLAGQVSMLVGPPNLGKSSIMSCFAAHLAMGKDLGSLRVKKTAVLYVAAEDATGIAERAFACWDRQSADYPHFYIHRKAVNLTDHREMAQFRNAVHEFQNKIMPDRMLIVFDTLNLCIGDGDENSSRDMSIVVGHVGALAAETGAHVMMIHHTGNGDQGKPRGSSALLSNVDTMLVLSRAEGYAEQNLVFLRQLKQRSVQKGDPLLFQVCPILVGHDQDGEPITVPVARLVETSERPLAKPTEASAGRSEPDARSKELLRVLVRMAEEKPQDFIEPRRMADLVAAGFESVRSNPDALRKAVRRALDHLVERKVVETDGNGAFRASASAKRQ